MFHIVAFILLSIIYLSLEKDMIELPLYGNITTDKEIYFYVNVSSFLVGEKIEVEISFESNCSIKTISIGDCPSSSISPCFFSYTAYKTKNYHQFHFGVTGELKWRAKYWVFETPSIKDCPYPTLEIIHNKEIQKYKLPIYGEKVVSRQSSLYLDAKNFSIFDKIYIKLIFINKYNYTYKDIKLKYYQNDDPLNFDKNKFNSQQSYIYTKTGDYDTFYFEFSIKRV